MGERIDNACVTFRRSAANILQTFSTTIPFFLKNITSKALYNKK